jgi:hypothetical protein
MPNCPAEDQQIFYTVLSSLPPVHTTARYHQHKDELAGSHFRSYLARSHDTHLSGTHQGQIQKTPIHLSAKKYECRDRISTHTLAKPAKVAKNSDSEGFPPAKPLLRSANVIDTGAGVHQSQINCQAVGPHGCGSRIYIKLLHNLALSQFGKNNVPLHPHSFLYRLT